jgi:large subunit ribosomal protein L15
MTTRFKKKVRKWRGRTSHGWGAKKKHRGSGSQGGHGMGGGHKHKYSWVTTYAPDYFGYKGFFSKQKKEKAINIGDLEKMSGNEINLRKMGYGKLLGKGKLTRAITVTVNSCSAQAKEKVEKAGGQVKSK